MDTIHMYSPPIHMYIYTLYAVIHNMMGWFAMLYVQYSTNEKDDSVRKTDWMSKRTTSADGIDIDCPNRTMKAAQQWNDTDREIWLCTVNVEWGGDCAKSNWKKTQP